MGDSGWRERLERLADAAGLDPERDLTPQGRAALDRLGSEADDGLLAGLLDVLGATRQCEAERRHGNGGARRPSLRSAQVGSRRRGGMGQFGADPGPSGP